MLFYSSQNRVILGIKWEVNRGSSDESLKGPELCSGFCFRGWYMGSTKRKLLSSVSQHHSKIWNYVFIFPPLTKLIFKSITLEEAVALLELYLVVMVISFSWAIYFIFVSKPLFGKN